VAVLAGEVGDRADAPLSPQIVVVEGGDLAHVDAGADDRAARGELLERLGHELPGRGEDDRRVERLGRPLIASSGPGGSKLLPELLGACVVGARERVHGSALVSRHLADHVCRRAEAVETEAVGVAGEPERAVADQPAAEQRRDFFVAQCFGQRQAVTLVGNRQLRIASVDVAAGEATVEA
jgi:hypothetical protein